MNSLNRLVSKTCNTKQAKHCLEMSFFNVCEIIDCCAHHQNLNSKVYGCIVTQHAYTSHTCVAACIHVPIHVSQLHTRPHTCVTACIHVPYMYFGGLLLATIQKKIPAIISVRAAFIVNVENNFLRLIYHYLSPLNLSLRTTCIHKELSCWFYALNALHLSATNALNLLHRT